MDVVATALMAALMLYNSYDRDPRFATFYGVMALTLAGAAGWRARKFRESKQ
jgi:hypothetical protein